MNIRLNDDIRKAERHGMAVRKAEKSWNPLSKYFAYHKYNDFYRRFEAETGLNDIIAAYKRGYERE